MIVIYMGMKTFINEYAEAYKAGVSDAKEIIDTKRILIFVVGCVVGAATMLFIMRGL